MSKSELKEIRVIDPNRIYTLEQVAVLLGVRPRTVLEYCRKGELIAKRVGKLHIIGNSVIAFLSDKNTR